MNNATPTNYIDALVSGLATPEERERRPLMVLQNGYFDDSGSDALSRYYLLAGFIAPVEQWKDFSTKWASILNREGLSFFKMSHAMAFDGQFKRWTEARRNSVIMEMAGLIEELNPWRIESFLNQDLFNTFVRGILQSTSFDNPYFMLFYQIVFSAGMNAERIGWNPDCDFIFDEQGTLADNAVSKWKWVKENIDGIQQVDIGRHLGSPPIFRNDISFRPLQGADMFAWLVRDCMTVTPPRMKEISRAALKYMEGSGKTIRLHIDRDMLIKLGSSFIVGKAKLAGYL